MITKLELLKKMKQKVEYRIQGKEYTLIEDALIDETTTGCYCIVGYALHCAGVKDEEILKIQRVFPGKNVKGMVRKATKDNPTEIEKQVLDTFINTFDDLSIEFEDLQKLQYLNDMGQWEVIDRRLGEMIQQEEGAKE